MSIFRYILISACLLACTHDASAQYVRNYHRVHRAPSYKRSYSSNPYSNARGSRYSAYGRRSYGLSGSRSRPSLTQQLAVATAGKRGKTPYRLDAGDMLAVIVEGVLSFKDAPVHIPGKDSSLLPGMGYPIPVMEDGTVVLPYVNAISVRGLTTSEAQKKVARSYYDKNILKESEVILVSLLRKRTVEVTVLHGKRDSTQDVSVVNLTPDEAHVLGAISQLKSFDPLADLRIYRGGRNQVSPSAGLADGDLVDMRSPKTKYFYTGGILPGGQFELPNDRPVSMVQAIAIAGGSFGAGRLTSFPPSDLVVVRNGRPAFTVDINSALRNPRLMVQPGDTLLLRYKPGEIAANLAASSLFGAARFIIP